MPKPDGRLRGMVETSSLFNMGFSLFYMTPFFRVPKNGGRAKQKNHLLCRCVSSCFSLQLKTSNDILM